MPGIMPGNCPMSRFLGPVIVTSITAVFCLLSFTLIFPTINNDTTAAWLQTAQLSLAIVGVFFLWVCNCTDPGTLTAASAPPELEPTAEHDATRQRGQLREATVNGVIVPFRWCDTCMLWRPPRASHCGTCRRCFERFDHHCPTVGTCIARGNHRFFVAFLSTITPAALCMVASLVVVFEEHRGFEQEPTNWTGVMWLVLIFCCLGCVIFGSLCAWGIGVLMMLCCNLTIKEVNTDEAIRTQLNSNPCAVSDFTTRKYAGEAQGSSEMFPGVSGCVGVLQAPCVHRGCKGQSKVYPETQMQDVVEDDYKRESSVT